MNKEFLLRFLNQQNVGKAEFAEIIGVTEGAVTHWLNGIREIPETTVRLMMYFDENDLDIRTFYG